MTKNNHYIGLNETQVIESRKRNGENVLTPPKKESFWKKFFDKFKDPLIVILLVAGFLSIGISFFEFFKLNQPWHVFFEPLGIFIAIFLATGLSFLFEYKADKEFAILNKVNDDECVIVIRNGNHTNIPRKDIVVGDIVVLTTGNEVPADGELLESNLLNVDESSLTGEPIAYKSTNPLEFDKDATFPTNHVMRGTKVMEGHGIMRVLAVGDATENGKVYEAAQIDNSIKTPLDEQLDHLGKFISRAAWVFAIAVIIGRIVVYSINIDQNIDWINAGTFILQTIMIAVTLVVVSVPEGLPMAVTLSLAYSMRRMLKTNNLVRRMHACETMGATTVICTDKTGTLTQNQMQVADLVLLDDNLPLLYDNMAVNSTAELDYSKRENPVVLGNPTEGALLLYLNKLGISYQIKRENNRIIAELPFSTERKYMATISENTSGEKYLFVKGAPEIVYNLCHIRPDKDVVESKLHEYQSQAMRTLGFAYAKVDNNNTIKDNNLIVSDLVFEAIIAISDPVRSDVPHAVAEAINAGIDVKIVTGDTPGTAQEIGRQVGLWNNADYNDYNIITGPQFEALSDTELQNCVKDIKIIARARPLDKRRLVEALQQQNQVVAVTGDGTNDAPALKAAHVGLSMGDGTSVAKEASDITIIDNSFSSIGKAVMWGRSLYRNIQRFIVFQMTVNVVACLIVLIGAFLGQQSPLTVTQMLWVNLIMDTFAAMALAALPPTPAVMLEKPRNRKAFIVTPAMWKIIISEGLIFFIILTALLVLFQHTDITCLYNFSDIVWGNFNGLTSYELSLFFTIFVFLQFWNMFNARAFATGKSAFHLKHCGEFILITVLILAGQIAIVQFGGEFFEVVPLKFLDWIIIIFSTSIVLIIGEFIRCFKMIFNRKLIPNKQ